MSSVKYLSPCHITLSLSSSTFGILVSPYVVREDEENHVSRFLHGQNILRGNNIAMYEEVVKVVFGMHTILCLCYITCNH